MRVSEGDCAKDGTNPPQSPNFISTVLDILVLRESAAHDQTYMDWHLLLQQTAVKGLHMLGRIGANLRGDKLSMRATAATYE